jgi:hypothetical protein
MWFLIVPFKNRMAMAILMPLMQLYGNAASAGVIVSYTLSEAFFTYKRKKNENKYPMKLLSEDYIICNFPSQSR